VAPKTAEPVTNAARPQGTDKFFSQEEVNELIEKARSQEKDKLYPTIEKGDQRMAAMDEELKNLKKFRKTQEEAEAARLKAVEDANRAKEEAELSAKELIERRNSEFDARIAQMTADNETRIAMMEQEVKFNQMQAYIQRRIMEESANIVPELVDFVSGDTPEQIEQSIELLKTKSAAIVDAARGARTRQQASMPGVAPVAGTNGVTPLDQPGDRQVTAEDIRGMNMQEFAALRQRVNMPTGSGRGLFD
jgi:hypothetical protein